MKEGRKTPSLRKVSQQQAREASRQLRGPEERPLWIPGQCVKPYHERHAKEKEADMAKDREI